MPTRGGARRASRRAIPSVTDTSPVQVTSPTDEGMTFRERYEVYKAKHRFWLVQRIERATGPRGWFDNKFELDYMGSAEFEFGATHESLRRIRGAGVIVIKAVEASRDDVAKVVYFVGPLVGIDKKVADFHEWFGQEWPRAKEFTKFDEVFTGKPFMAHWPVDNRTIAWWSLDDDILWTLDEQVALELHYGIMNPPTS